MAESAPSPAPVQVCDLDVILFLPLRIKVRPKSGLDVARSNSNCKPSTWLCEFAAEIQRLSATGGSGWERLQRPFEEKFGFPDLYDTDTKRFTEFAYFHPFIQRILYEPDTVNRAIEVLVRHDCRKLDIELNDGHRLLAEVRRAQMFLSITDLAVVAVQLHVPANQLVSTGDEGEVDPASSLRVACNFLDQVRRVYTPYWIGAHPGQTPLRARWLDANGDRLGEIGDYACQAQIAETLRTRQPPLAGHWRSLVSPWCGADRDSCIWFEQFGDERCHTLAHVSVDRPHDLPEHHFYRLAFLDAYDEYWPYSADFLRQQACDIFYDRFWNKACGWMNTRYFCTGYSFVMLRAAAGPAYLYDHFQNHYFFLNLLALVQKSSMLIAWQRLSEVLRKYADADRSPQVRAEFHRDQKWLAEDMADYLALFEFSEVSNQLQALELFAMLRKNMHCDKLLTELMQQVQYARGVEGGNYEELMATEQRQLSEAANQFADQQTMLTRIATKWLPVSLALAFLGISFGIDRFGYWLSFGTGGQFPDWRGLLTTLGVPIACWLVFYLLFRAFSIKVPAERRHKGTGALAVSFHQKARSAASAAASREGR